MRKNYEKFHNNDRPAEQMLNTDLVLCDED